MEPLGENGHVARAPRQNFTKAFDALGLKERAQDLKTAPRLLQMKRGACGQPEVFNARQHVARHGSPGRALLK